MTLMKRKGVEMNRRFLVLSLLVALVCLPAIAFGQWSDDFDSYALGQLTSQSTWEGWGVPRRSGCG